MKTYLLLLLLFILSHGTQGRAESRLLHSCARILRTATTNVNPINLKIKNQGRKPVCSWYAKTTLLEDYNRSVTGKYTELSADGLIAQYMIHTANHAVEYDTYPWALEYDDNRTNYFIEPSTSYYFSRRFSVPTQASWIESPIFHRESFKPFTNGAIEIYKSKITKNEKLEKLAELAYKTLGHFNETPQSVDFSNLQFVHLSYSPNSEPIQYIMTGSIDLSYPFSNLPDEVKTRGELLEILDQLLKHGHPVVASVAWDFSVENRVKGQLNFALASVLNRPNYSKPDHGIFIYGKDRFGRYKAQNSWGQNVGRAGHYLIGRNYLKHALFAVEYIANSIPSKSK